MVWMSINMFFWHCHIMTMNSCHTANLRIWALRIEFHFMKFYLKILSGHFLCCHQQMKKHLEAPSRCPLAVQTREKERPILCIDVWRYLQKEKEETNFLYKARGISANKSQGRSKIKEDTNPRLLEDKHWPCDISEEGIFAHEYVMFYKRGN